MCLIMQMLWNKAIYKKPKCEFIGKIIILRELLQVYKVRKFLIKANVSSS